MSYYEVVTLDGLAGEAVSERKSSGKLIQETNAKLAVLLKPLHPAIDADPVIPAAIKRRIKTEPVDALLDLFKPIDKVATEIIAETNRLSGKQKRTIGIPKVNQITVDMKVVYPEIDNVLPREQRELVQRLRIVNNFMILVHYDPVNLGRATTTVLTKYGFEGAKQLGDWIRKGAKGAVEQFQRASKQAEKKAKEAAKKAGKALHDAGANAQKAAEAGAKAAGQAVAQVVAQVPPPPPPPVVAPPAPKPFGFSGLGIAPAVAAGGATAGAGAQGVATGVGTATTTAVTTAPVTTPPIAVLILQLCIAGAPLAAATVPALVAAKQTVAGSEQQSEQAADPNVALTATSASGPASGEGAPWLKIAAGLAAVGLGYYLVALRKKR